MDILTRACWYATWCQACGFKVARRRWLEDVVMVCIATCRAPDLSRRTIGESEHVANLRC
jgi:hypothetical protein